jgi:hypothetical protein
MGFGTHPHRDMEIVSYVLEGELEHQDSMGNGSIIRPGDVQRMSAGTGVLHSERNPSRAAGVHFLQIWIRPDRNNVTPSYEQKHFTADEKRGRLRLVLSPDGVEGSVRIQQNARMYAGLFDAAEQAALDVAAGRMVYVHVARGAVSVNGTRLAAGDAVKLADTTRVEIADGTGTEVLVFDLPGVRE